MREELKIQRKQQIIIMILKSNAVFRMFLEFYSSFLDHGKAMYRMFNISESIEYLCNCVVLVSGRYSYAVIAQVQAISEPAAACLHARPKTVCN